MALLQSLTFATGWSGTAAATSELPQKPGQHCRERFLLWAGGTGQPAHSCPALASFAGDKSRQRVGKALQLVEKEAGNAVSGPECVKERQWWQGNRMPFFSSLSSGEATVLEKRGAHESAVSYLEGADKIWERRSRTYITVLNLSQYKINC